ncbi:hypothetical protein FB645_004132 [Coemansia sp. IMI 203386]|nr:hypothetical protein FB645_004132 [Coemansia sp. IMI 203386]
MKIKVRFSAKENTFVYLVVEKTEPVERVRKMAAKELSLECDMDITPERLSLIYSGKQLADGMKLFDYSVSHGDALLAIIKQAKREITDEPNAKSPADSPEIMDSRVVPDITEQPHVNGNQNPESAQDTEEPIKCDFCDNASNSKCTRCGCQICGGKEDDANTLACDECGQYFHIWCLPTPLSAVPNGDWYCHFCQNDPNEIISGEKKLDLSKTRKAKMPSATQKRKWGGGKACAGTSKTCSVVPKNHVGAIPGVRVGQSWRFRIHVSEAGVHRPPVGGIAGSSTSPAVSIVLSGGYPEDEDHGDWFYYTGSGGYDLSGNKRQAKQQAFDQELTRQNKSLALACAAPIDEIKGSEAEDWTQSSPIRVCRSYKAAKMHPEYAPAEGVRYDGLYKVVSYWRQKGVSGFYVWRYLFRRDDPEPAPWTEEGKENIERLGLVMYESDNEDDTKGAGSKKSGAGVGTFKKPKVQLSFIPSAELLQMMALDKVNKRLWDKVGEKTYNSEKEYLDNLCENELSCPICQELVQRPCTTPCGHNICNACLCLSRKKYGEFCPMCRSEIASMGTVEEVREQLNHNLVTVLRALIPSYGQDWLTPVKVTEKQRAVRMGMPINVLE